MCSKLIFGYILGQKIEVVLCGQPTNSFKKQNCIANSSKSAGGSNSDPEIDFLTFCTLRPISIITPFIKEIMEKYIDEVNKASQSIASVIGSTYRVCKH